MSVKEVANELLDYGFSVFFFIAGIAGALASLSKTKNIPFTQRVITVLSGGFTAAYITPLFVDVFGLSSNGSQYGAAFIVGFSGLKTVEWIIDAIRSRIKSEK